MDEILRSPREHQIIVTQGVALTFVVMSWFRMPIVSLGYVNLPTPSGLGDTRRLQS